MPRQKLAWRIKDMGSSEQRRGASRLNEQIFLTVNWLISA